MQRHPSVSCARYSVRSVGEERTTREDAKVLWCHACKIQFKLASTIHTATRQEDQHQALRCRAQLI